MMDMHTNLDRQYGLAYHKTGQTTDFVKDLNIVQDKVRLGGKVSI